MSHHFAYTHLEIHIYIVRDQFEHKFANYIPKCTRKDQQNTHKTATCKTSLMRERDARMQFIYTKATPRTLNCDGCTTSCHLGAHRTSAKTMLRHFDEEKLCGKSGGGGNGGTARRIASILIVCTHTHNSAKVFALRPNSDSAPTDTARKQTQISIYAWAACSSITQSAQEQTIYI